MPVNVEAEITPSKRQWLYLYAPVVSGALFLVIIQAPWLMLLLWSLLFVVGYYWIESEYQSVRIRVQEDEILLWPADDTMERWLWEGEGRLSHAFIQWNLSSVESERLNFRVWKDSVSDASWRALNMAYRVNRVAAQQAVDRP